MTLDETRQEFAKQFVTTFSDSLEKHGEQLLSEVRAKHPATYRSLVDALFGDVEDKDKLTDSMIFDELFKRMKRQSV